MFRLLSQLPTLKPFSFHFQDLYIKTLDQLKKSAVREQVVAGRKFSGVSFKSNPKLVHFKDFTVGQRYTIKIVLTNISYTINTCKYLDISDKLKDFITIDFQPPGQLSAGLTCEFNVTFEPKINKDLEGELQFMAGNGPFSIPISCTIKKCDLSVNTSSIYFGTIVIGEEANRKVQLINKGALGTTFKIISQDALELRSSLDYTGSDLINNVSSEPVKAEKVDGIRLGAVSIKIGWNHIEWGYGRAFCEFYLSVIRGVTLCLFGNKLVL